jgi:sRNA-binding regulator protein Hfq
MFSIHRIILMSLDDLDLFVQGHVKIFATYTTESKSGTSAVFKMTHEVEPGVVWKCGKIRLIEKNRQVHFFGEISTLAQPDEKQHFQLIVSSILDDLVKKGVIVMDARNAKVKELLVEPGPTPSVAGEIKIKTTSKSLARWGTSSQTFFNDAEGETLTVHLMTGDTVTGELIGLDTFDIVILPEGGNKIIVPKHAIAYAHIEDTQP